MGQGRIWECPKCNRLITILYGCGMDFMTEFVREEPLVCRDCHEMVLVHSIVPGCEDTVAEWKKEPNAPTQLQLQEYTGCPKCGSKETEPLRYGEYVRPGLSATDDELYDVAPLCPDCEVPMETDPYPQILWD